MNDIKEIEIFKRNFSSLQKTSYDETNKCYMTDSQLQVIHFDNVVKNRGKEFGPERPKSNDALYIADDGKMYFIEFKNGRIGTEVKLELKLKICESLLMFMDITKKDLCFIRENLSYILVYNEEGYPLTNQELKELDGIMSRLNPLTVRLSSKAEEYFVRFAFRRFKNFYFKEVFTLNKEEFEDYININKWENKLC